MFWWFERKGEFLSRESRQAPDGTFELCIVTPGGSERLERFRDAADLARRQAELEREVKSNGWSGPIGVESLNRAVVSSGARRAGIGPSLAVQRARRNVSAGAAPRVNERRICRPPDGFQS